MGVSCKVEDLRGESRPVLPLRDQPALFRQREGRCSRYGGAIFGHFGLGTDAFVLKINFLLSFCSFSIDAVFVFRLRFRFSSTSSNIKIFIFSIGKVLITYTY